MRIMLSEAAKAMPRKMPGRILAGALVIIIGGCTMSSTIDIKTEKIKVEETIRDSIEWPFPEKNFDRLYSSLARDASFFIFHPDSASTIVGYEAFDKMIKTVFRDDKLKPTSTEIKDLRINLSEDGRVAWFSCILDDIGEYGDRKWAWLNCRWTGVLQKTEDKWLIYQMHFSFASDAKNDGGEGNPNP
jgi:ketosteroid isomerase-like protein